MRRKFLQTAAMGVSLSPLSQVDVDRESRDESWYVVDEHRADSDDVRYIVRVDEELDELAKQSEAFYLAGDTDRDRFPEANRPDGVLATIVRQVDRTELQETIKSGDVYRVRNQVLAFLSDEVSDNSD